MLKSYLWQNLEILEGVSEVQTVAFCIPVNLRKKVKKNVLKSLTDFQSSQQFMRCSSSLEVALRQQIHKNKSVSDLNDKSKSKLK